jgi:hypothetical protein
MAEPLFMRASSAFTFATSLGEDERINASKCAMFRDDRALHLKRRMLLRV